MEKGESEVCLAIMLECMVYFVITEGHHCGYSQKVKTKPSQYCSKEFQNSYDKIEPSSLTVF
jgi:hypothetical protein